MFFSPDIEELVVSGLVEEGECSDSCSQGHSWTVSEAKEGSSQRDSRLEAVVHRCVGRELGPVQLLGQSPEEPAGRREDPCWWLGGPC